MWPFNVTGIGKSHLCPQGMHASSFCPFYSLQGLFQNMNLLIVFDFLLKLIHLVLKLVLSFDWSNSFPSLPFNSLTCFLHFPLCFLLLE